jgi:hypothetical protein
MMTSILDLQRLPALTALDLRFDIDGDDSGSLDPSAPPSCTVCSYTCSKTAEEEF